MVSSKLLVLTKWGMSWAWLVVNGHLSVPLSTRVTEHVYWYFILRCSCRLRAWNRNEGAYVKAPLERTQVNYVILHSRVVAPLLIDGNLQENLFCFYH